MEWSGAPTEIIWQVEAGAHCALQHPTSISSINDRDEYNTSTVVLTWLLSG